ncbi:MAG: prepilin-type N-terminal cleavage/methylation domain-containing protein [Aquabacterium sp.]
MEIVPVSFTPSACAFSRRRQAGFTMVELVVIMVIVGILAVYALPKMAAAINLRQDSWRDQLVSTLRYAQKSAVAHRRLVCVDVQATTVSMTIAPANPATTCTTALTGPDGNATFATSDDSSVATSTMVLYFQPDGRVTTDGAGATATNRTISGTGLTSITVYAETGYVE